MRDRQDDLNPASDPAPLADALRSRATGASGRDALLFEAGKAGPPAPGYRLGLAVGHAGLRRALGGAGRV